MGENKDRLDPAVVERIRALLSASPFPSDLAIHLLEASAGRAVVEMPWEGRLTQYQGIMHGGALVTLLDTTVTMAFLTVLPRELDVVTIELKVNFLSPVAGGPIVADGRVIHRGRRTSVGEAEIRDPSGKTAAKGLVTAMIVGQQS